MRPPRNEGEEHRICRPKQRMMNDPHSIRRIVIDLIVQKFYRLFAISGLLDTISEFGHSFDVDPEKVGVCAN